MCGASRGVSAAITMSTLSIHQPVVARPARTTSASIASESASRRLSSDAGNSVPRSGRPTGPSSASATACATASPSEWPGEPRRVGDPHAAEHERRLVAERVDVEAEPDPVPHVGSRPRRAAPARARGRRRAVILRLRRSPSTTTTTPPSASTSAASSVSIAADSVRGAQRVGPERLRRLHADESLARTRSRRPGRRRRASPCRTPAAPAPRRRRRRRPPARPGRTARARRAVAPRRARPRSRRRRAPTRARRAPSRSASRRRPRRAHRRGAVQLASAGSDDDHAVARFLRDTDRAVDHARVAERRELLGRAEARAAPAGNDDRPGAHRASIAGVYASRRANTRRPALVGTTDVTCSITSGPPTSSSPPFTTTIDPSSR